MKKVLLTLWLLCLLYGICIIFWHCELKYTLPTPVPQNYTEIKTGEHIELTNKMLSENNKPLFIHFFNPECPCSRFNMPHFKSLIKKYGDQFTFAVVVINKSKDKNYTPDDIQEKYDLTVPVLFDQSIAEKCGVYSTPQAVILDAGHKLYYRGNYNKSRYCSDTKSEYARMAIDSFLLHHANPVFTGDALTAYGCQTTACYKK